MMKRNAKLREHELDMGIGCLSMGSLYS